jgi:hypothetical protein
LGVRLDPVLAGEKPGSRRLALDADHRLPVECGLVPRFELQFPPDQIGALASRFPGLDDARYRAAGEAVRTRGYYRRPEFIMVCRWKTPRSAPRVAHNSARSIRRATGGAISTGDEASRMEALLELEGVGVPTASTLLYFVFPESYPILDIRALESLGVKPRSVYPVGFWLEYLTACRQLAGRYGVDLRTLDKALWQHSKERSAGARPELLEQLQGERGGRAGRARDGVDASGQVGKLLRQRGEMGRIDG